jgi:hypothetical protein
MPVGELGVVVESQEYDGCSKSIKYKAVERHKQANEVLRASSLGKLRGVFIKSERKSETHRIDMPSYIQYRFKSYE